MLKTVHLVIKGKVQGVFYRASAKEAAGKLGLGGWIKNKKDGSVEAVATGTEEQLNQFIEWCNTGSKRAEVTSLEVTELVFESFPRFQIIN